MAASKTVFRAKADITTLLQNLLAIPLMIVLVLTLWKQQTAGLVGWLVPAASVLWLYMLDALLFTSVTVAHDTLIARAGHFAVRRVPLDRIIKITTIMPPPVRGKSMVQTLALGKKRLYLILKDSEESVCISPFEDQAFIALIRSRGVEVEADVPADAPAVIQE